VLPGGTARGTGAMERVGRAGRSADEIRHEGLMDMDGERLGEEISEVASAFAPLDGEVTLTNTVADPVEAHVDGLCAMKFDRVVGDANCTGVVTEDDGGWLGIAEGDCDGAKPFANACEHV